MLENIIAGLIVAAVTGLTYLAYAHPKTYKYADEALDALWYAGLAGSLGYASGYTNALQSLKNVPDGAWQRVPDIILITAVFGGIYLYKMFLKHVVTRLKNAESDDKGGA